MKPVSGGWRRWLIENELNQLSDQYLTGFIVYAAALAMCRSMTALGALSPAPLVATISTFTSGRFQTSNQHPPRKLPHRFRILITATTCGRTL
jgi:hypothetical protein